MNVKWCFPGHVCEKRPLFSAIDKKIYLYQNEPKGRIYAQVGDIPTFC